MIHLRTLAALLVLAALLPFSTTTHALPDQGNGCVPTLPQVAHTTTVGLPITPTWDYGDAPDNTHVAGMTTWYTAPGSPIGKFPTLAATGNTIFPGQPGARHQVVAIGWLGNNSAYAGPGTFTLSPSDEFPSLEADADAVPDADPTTNLVGPSPDHDLHDNGLYAGIVGPAPGPGTLTFRVSTTTGITNWYVNALIDWNYDGSWSAPDATPEWVVVNMPVTVPPLTSATFTSPTFTVGPSSYTPWLRLTLSDTPIVPPGGAAWDGSVPPGTFDFNGAPAFKCGETEDYCGPITVRGTQDPTRDFHVTCQPKQGLPP